jgi:hypothetical protein
MRFVIAMLALATFASTAGATDLEYGQRVRVDGQEGQVISHNNHGSVVVETHDFRGRSTGTTTLTRFDQAFRRQLRAGLPSYLNIPSSRNFVRGRR